MRGIEKDRKTGVAGGVRLSNGVGIDLEAIVRDAVSGMSEADRAVIAAAEDEPADRTAAGAKLDRLVTRRLRQVAPGNGWIVHVNRTVGSFPGMDAATCARTVADFVRRELPWYEDELRPIFLSRHSGKLRLVGHLRPDLVIQDPTRVVTVWDLTSREEIGHLSKTLLYAHVFARGT